jgi:predicted XRE-type DNA-binding protein
MAKRKARVETGSGNVFTDLGYADAKERTLKVELAVEVNRLLRSRGLTQAAAAKLLGILQPHVSDLVRYRLERFSVERLMAFLVELGQDVEIRIRARSGRGSRAAVKVLIAQG